MARGIGKTIVAAAKLLSNPVGAVASVFRKKKALKRGPTAASAGMVRRKYKKRSSAPVRSKVVNDGAGNVRMSKAIGYQPKPLARSLESKIRDMLNPANHHLIEQSGNVHVGVGETVYTHFEMMNAEDIDQVIAQSSATAGASQKYNGKVNIQNAKLQLMLRNQTTNLVTLRVYEYICRRDVPDKITVSPTNPAEVDGTTQSIIEQGFNYQSVSAIVRETIGGTLFQNPMFCTYYKILKVKNIQLGAGKCFNLSLSSLKAKTINPLVYNATDGDVLAGLTRGFVIQAQGSLVGPSGDDMYGQPTTGFVNFDWFCSRKYAYNQPWTGVARNTFSSNLPSPDKTWYHINEFQGLAQVQQQA
jgi:hypothetical protein